MSCALQIAALRDLSDGTSVDGVAERSTLLATKIRETVPQALPVYLYKEVYDAYGFAGLGLPRVSLGTVRAGNRGGVFGAVRRQLPSAAAVSQFWKSSHE